MGGRTGSSPSLSQLATSSGEGVGTGAGAPRRSLASLAQQTSTSTTTTMASRTAISATPGGGRGSGSSLSQLASANTNNAPPRRSLVGLASSSLAAGAKTNNATTEPATILSQPSGSPVTTTTTGSNLGRPGTAGLTLRSGGGLAGLSRAGTGSAGAGAGMGLRKDAANGSTASSPSLADLAAGGGRLGTSSLSGLAGAKASSTSGELRSSAGSGLSLAGLGGSTTKTSVSSSATEQETSNATTTTTTSPQEPALLSAELIDYSHDVSIFSEESDPTAAAFSSLIAPPSHFAVSIFEKLEPVPSPVAGARFRELQDDPAIRYGGYSIGGGGGGEVGVFAFDVPSPDDIVFKAQGQRPAATRT